MSPVMLSENQSTCAPPGVKHRLSSTDRLPLESTKVQGGNYLGEGDTVHFADPSARG